MVLTEVGLALAFLGSVLVGSSTQFGLGGGWGGAIVWKSLGWRIGNALGWVLLILGFFLQWFALRLTCAS